MMAQKLAEERVAADLNLEQREALPSVSTTDFITRMNIFRERELEKALDKYD